MFGVQAQRKGLTAMTVMADESASASTDEARKVVSGAKGRSVTRIEIGGREFWKSESTKKVDVAGKMRDASYATALNGYVLRFYIASFDAKLAGELKDSVEAITFFDPAKAEQVAGPTSRPYHPAAPHNAADTSPGAATVPTPKNLF